MKIGTTEIAGMKLGASDVIKAYQGTTLVYSQGDPYIETDGESWIELGTSFYPSDLIKTYTTDIGSTRYNVYKNLIMEIKYLLPDNTDSQYILGAESTNYFCDVVSSGKGHFILQQNNLLLGHDVSYGTEMTEKYTLGWSYYTMSDNTYSAYKYSSVLVNNATKVTDSWYNTSGAIPSASIRLFGFNSGSKTVGILSGQRIYGLKLWSRQFMISSDQTEVRNGDETLILNLVPDKIDGQGCLRDKLTDTYYTNQGTGTMTYVG